MPYRKIPLGLAAAAIASLPLAFAPAHAADLDYGYGAAPAPLEEAKVEFGSGWYVRGDIGATRGLVGRTGEDPYDYTESSYVVGGDAQTRQLVYEKFPRGVFQGPGLTPPYITSDSTSHFGYTASIGGGYQFNHWFRTDVVFDFRQPTKTSIDGSSRECLTGLGTATVGAITYEYPVVAGCTPTYQASLKTYDALVNGYVDLGTWGIVTPYVGAGIGLSFGYASASATYRMNNGVPYQVKFTDPVSGTTYYQNWDRKSSVQYYNFAYALMAGLSFDVFDHTKLDIGYRYLGLGKVLGTNLNTQEVRAGLRYMIDN